MDFNHTTSTGLGRGSISERRPLRPPLHPTQYYLSEPQPEYVPSEGGGSGKGSDPSVSRSYHIQNWHDQERKETVIAPVPSGDQLHPEQKNICSGMTPQSAGKKTFELSPYAKEFIPRNFQPETRVPPTMIMNSYETDHDTLADSYPIQELRQFLFDITLSPGKFDRRVHGLTDTLNKWVLNEETLRSIVNIILDESVREPNLRYSGARLCNYLSQNLHNERDVGNFRSLLLTRCMQEHNRRDDLANGLDGGNYLRGFALFLAELYSQMENGSSEHRRITALGDELLHMLKTLLLYHTPENLKCVCQILKLVGAYLEVYEKMMIPNAGCAPQLDEITKSIKEKVESEDYSRDIKTMIKNVIDLRANDWGRAPSSPVRNDPITTEITNEAVFYGPDGKPMSAEERMFLQSHQYGSDIYDGEDFEGEENAYDNEEMDEEIEAAYELYLRETGLKY